MRIKPEAMKAALSVAQGLRRRGYGARETHGAVMRALRSERFRRAGMGEDIFNVPPEQNILQRAASIEAVKKARETVSPWLWVLSIVSFGMAIVNRRQVQLMFRNWKRRKEGKTA